MPDTSAGSARLRCLDIMLLAIGTLRHGHAMVQDGFRLFDYDRLGGLDQTHFSWLIMVETVIHTQNVAQTETAANIDLKA